MGRKKSVWLKLLLGVCAVLTALGFVACGNLAGNSSSGGTSTGSESSSPADSGSSSGGQSSDSGSSSSSGDENSSSSSGDPSGEHKHTYAADWTTDGDYHWHAATCGHEEAVVKALHNWDKGEITTIATCKTAGVKTYTCEDCGATKTETLGTAEHTWVGSDVEATCLTGGYHLEKCSVCDKEVKSAFTAAAGHKFSKATCTEDAICSVCKTHGAPKTGHAYKIDENSVIEATCTTDGTATYACTHEGCDEHYEVVTEKATGHDFSQWMREKQDPLGTADACYEIVYTAYCEHDGCKETDEKREIVKEHIFRSSITEAALCNHEGTKTYRCEGCQYEYTEKFTDENAHAWNDGEAKEGFTLYTCTHEASHTRTVIRHDQPSATVKADTFKQAGEVELGNTSIKLDDNAKKVLDGKENVTVGAEALNQGDLPNLEGLGENAQYLGQTVYNLTMSAGEEAITNFGGKVTVRVPYDLQPGDDPDNIVIWYINGTELEEIKGAKYSNGYAIFETEHFSYYTVSYLSPYERCMKYDHAWQTYKQEATCLMSGYELRVCSRCGTQDEMTVLPAKGHAWTSQTTAATCEHDGESIFTCTACEESYTVKIPALSHVWTVTEKKNATCTESGYTKYVCDRDHTHTYEITEGQKKHSLQSSVIFPTCTEGGHTHNKCVLCGLETDTDFVNALGHATETKTVAPTCTQQGYTVTYCTRCDLEILRTDVVEAMGHSMKNGVCEVCGEGCNHNFEKTSTVDATCTEGGYEVFICSNCKAEEIRNKTNPKGHTFELGECKVCGEADKDAGNFYLNLLNSISSRNFVLTVRDMTIFVTEETKVIKDDQEPEITTDDEARLTQLDVMELNFGIAADGTLTAVGKGKIKYEQLASGSNKSVGTFDAKFYVKDEFLYASVESDNKRLTPSIKVVTGLDLVFGDMFGMSYEDFRSLIVWLNTDFKETTDSLLSGDDAVTVKFVKTLLDKLFDRTDTKNGYTFTLNIMSVKVLNELLDTKTVQDCLDFFLGEGSFEKFTSSLVGLLDKKVPEAVAAIEELGLDRAKVTAALDSLVALLRESLPEEVLQMFGIAGEEPFVSAVILDELLKQYKDVTVLDLICMFMAQGEEIPAEQLAEMKKMIKDTVNGYIEMLKTKTVYGFIEEMQKAMQPGGDQGGQENPGKDPVPDEPKPMASESSALFTMIAEMLDSLLPSVEEGFKFSFTTDKTGLLTDANFELVEVSLPVGGSRYENSNGSSHTVTEKNYSAAISGKFDFRFGVSYDTSAYEQMVKDCEAARPKFKENSVVTVYSSFVETKDEEIKDLVVSKRGKEMRIHTDSKGNPVKIVITQEEMQLNGGKDTYDQMRYYYGSIRSIVTEFTVSLNEFQFIYSASYCGDWDEYSFSGHQSRKTIETHIEKRYSTVTGTFVYERESDPYVYEDEYNSSAYYYYNAKTKEYKIESPHDMQVDEAHSDIKCGGYKTYTCANGCGYTYKSDIHHLGEMVETAVLKDGATSCEDGVIIGYTCTVCKVTEKEREIHDHYRFNQRIDLSEYGSKCGGYVLVNTCACGRYKNIDEIRHTCNCDFQPVWSDKSTTLFVCMADGCHFAFIQKNGYEIADDCLATWKSGCVFGVTATQDDDGNWTYTVPEEGVLSLESDRVEGYHHTTQHEVLNRDEKGRTLHEKVTCTKCSHLVSETTYEYDDNPLPEYPTVEAHKQTWHDVIYEKGTKVSEAEYCDLVVNGQTIRIYDWREHYEDEVRVGKSETVFEFEGGKYCTYTEIYREYKGDELVSEDRHSGVRHICGECLREGSCTQNAIYECLFCNEEFEENYYEHRHETQYVEGIGTVCIRCGLRGDYGLNGRVLFEDLSNTAIEQKQYVVGYYIRDWYPEKGDAIDMYQAIIFLVPREGEDYDVTAALAPVVSHGKYQSGTISFSIDTVKSLATEKGLTDYEIRVSFVPMGGYPLEYSITLDVHDWKEVMFVNLNNQQDITGLYCEHCHVFASQTAFGRIFIKGVSEVHNSDGTVTFLEVYRSAWGEEFYLVEEVA